MPDLIIEKAGLFTSIQDLGRFGHRKYGVPVSGAMDQQSAGLVNLLLNNPPNAALLEITLVGPEMTFEAPTIIAISGANLSPKINGIPISLNKAIEVNGGDRLKFGPQIQGTRAYLGLAGGIQVTEVLNSRSMYHPVTDQSLLQDKSTLKYHLKDQLEQKYSTLSLPESHFSNLKLEVNKGPEFDLLSPETKQTLTKKPFVIGGNNRMGYRLKQNDMPENDHSIITSPVVPGTIQLTPSGELMVLMRDAQVTGGYPRVLQLTAESINQFSQKSTGQKVFFTFDLNKTSSNKRYYTN